MRDTLRATPDTPLSRAYIICVKRRLSLPHRAFRSTKIAPKGHGQRLWVNGAFLKREKGFANFASTLPKGGVVGILLGVLPHSQAYVLSSEAQGRSSRDLRRSVSKLRH